MSILDDAIREHLELKRAHGADDSELKKLEDEAFGPPQRPDEVDPFAEAPTEFLTSPAEPPANVPAVGDEGGRRRPDIADLQEAPSAPSGAPVPADAAAPGAPPAPTDAAPAEELVPAPDAPPPSPADAADVPLPPPAGEAPAAVAPTESAPPAPESARAAESTDAAPAPESSATEEVTAGDASSDADAGPNTEERHAFADQPTQMFDVQAHVDAEAEAPAAAEAAPSDEELVDAAQSEPQAAPPAPDAAAADATPVPVPADEASPTEEPVQEPLDTRGPDAEVAGHPPAEGAPTEEESAEFDFFNEQRLSDELDQALEAPLPPTDEHIAMPQYGDAPPPPAGGGIFDFESEGTAYEEDPSEEALRRHDAPEPPPEERPRNLFDPPSEELEAPSEEYEAPSEESDPPSEETPHSGAEPASEEHDVYSDPDTGHEDVLEDRPKFLEDDEDEVWFEQKPPKDFDLD